MAAGIHRRPSQNGWASPAKLYVARRAETGSLSGHIQYGATDSTAGLDAAALLISKTSKAISATSGGWE
jgi:hypothetical protein